MTLDRLNLHLWLHLRSFSKLMPINGYEVYQSGRLIIGIDWTEKECMIFTYEYAGKDKIVPLQKVETFLDIHSLIQKIEIYLDRRYV